MRVKSIAHYTKLNYCISQAIQNSFADEFQIEVPTAFFFLLSIFLKLLPILLIAPTVYIFVKRFVVLIAEWRASKRKCDHDCPLVFHNIITYHSCTRIQKKKKMIAATVILLFFGRLRYRFVKRER